MAHVFEIVPPRPETVTEALRAVGYEITTAIADIVDNSLFAGAHCIKVEMHWDFEDSWVRISDDGIGMSASELTEAMRLGTRSPLEQRDPADLGRFGLGLKTASFSQCRRVSVRSCREGSSQQTRCWDLDFVREHAEWALLTQAPDDESNSLLGEFSPGEHGTVVLWQKLDRVVPAARTHKASDRFLEHIEAVSRHLGMVFHRYLTGPKRVDIRVNGSPVDVWDPFLTDISATQVLPAESFGSSGAPVLVQPYVLPHESKLTADQHRDAAGVKGWNAQQGFYVYRNRRLLVPGGWFGMFQQEEHHKLARIMVDISNTLDLDWQIDIRKATARPPAVDRAHLHRIAKKTREQARRVYGHRGAKLAHNLNGQPAPVWRQVQHHGVVSYRINREHPLVKHLLSGGTILAADVRAALSVIEESIPVNVILAQFAENHAAQASPFHGRPQELVAAINSLLNALREQGLSGEQLRRELLAMEPFSHFPEVIASLDLNKSDKESSGV